MYIQRVYQKTSQSILLLGPRGTGKSTFIRNELKPDLTIDLLKHTDFRTLSLNPTQLESYIAHLKPTQSVFIDEIQKLPVLMDEVHRLLENFKINFILSGSSARKLRREGVNLLAGRAVSKKMYPLSLYEIGSRKKISELLFTGTLPSTVAMTDSTQINDYLFSYVETYLKEEIFQEGLTRNLNMFSRFIEIAGQYHGQILNYESISRELGISGDTVRSWFQILYDTLLGYSIEPYALRAFLKETKHPRFYYFDPGIARAAEGITTSNLSERVGHYFEGLIINELKVYFEVQRKNYKIFYYSVSGTGDIDLIVETKKKALSSPAKIVCIEIKHTKEWSNYFNKMMSKVMDAKAKTVDKSIGIYLGDKRISKGKISIYPLHQFIEALWKGDVF